MTAAIERLFRRPTYSLAYMPAIDGIRFMAIFLVVIHHMGHLLRPAYPSNEGVYWFWNHLWMNGFKGVPIFFMLSGFILTIPFAKQHIGLSGNVNLKSYFLRRLIRLEPPYIIAMSFWCFLQILEAPQNLVSSVQHLLVSFVYLHNYIYHHSSYINAVAWSLEVEIQFYILAPLLCCIFRLNKVARRAILLIASCVWIGLQMAVHPAFTSLFQYLHYFLLGMLLADFQLTGWPDTLKKSVFVLLFPVALSAMVLLPILASAVIASLFPFLVFLVLMLVLGNETLRSFFSFKWLTLIGGMCYSIYLLHLPLLYIVYDYLSGLGLKQGGSPSLVAFIVLLSFVILVISSLFYLTVEKPFMKLSMRRNR